MPPSILIAVGLICSSVLGLMQARISGVTLPEDPYLQMPAAALMAVLHRRDYLARPARRARAPGRQLRRRRFLVAFLVAMTLNVTAQHRVIPAEGDRPDLGGVIFAGALLFSGLIGSLPMLAGGVAMLVATGIAGYNRDWLVGILAVGWFLGFVVPGLFLARCVSHGRIAAL